MRKLRGFHRQVNSLNKAILKKAQQILSNCLCSIEYPVKVVVPGSYNFSEWCPCSIFLHF